MDKKESTIGTLMILTGVGIILFWIGFFTVGLAPENAPPCYLAFEHSFPLPDGVLALALLYAGIALIKGNPRGATAALAAGGGLVFLGLIDFSFNIQNGMYALSAADLVMNAFLNAWCVFFGLAIIRRFVFRPR